MRKSQSKASKVRDYQIKHPNATVKQISKATGAGSAYIYALQHKARMQRKAATVTITPASSKQGGITVAVDQVAQVTPERMERIAHALGQPRMRMASAADSQPNDVVNHPSHYKVGGIETIDFIEAKKLDYHLGNVIKYITRADHKGDRMENLRKAQWYLNRAIERAGA